VIRTQLADSTEKYGRILGTLFVNGDPMSLNDRMVGLGYAWGYDGGTKLKDLGALALRKLHPTVAPLLMPVPTAVQA
jgi:micrococcal nuclease